MSITATTTMMQQQAVGRGLRKVLMPMIRKVIPGLIAQQIVGVQPMTGPTGRVFKFGERDTTITMMDMPMEDYKVMLERCMRFFGDRIETADYVLDNYQFKFWKYLSELTYKGFIRLEVYENGKRVWLYDIFSNEFDEEGVITDDDWDDKMAYGNKVLTQAIVPYDKGTEFAELEEFIEDYL